MTACSTSRLSRLFLAALGLVAPAFAQTSDPFPQPIPRGGAVVSAMPFARIPGVRGQTARVNQLVPAPDGRLFVVDQLGPLYSVSADGKSVGLYLDLGPAAGVNLVSGGELGFESLAFHPDFARIGAAGYGKFYTAHTSSNTAPPADFTPGGGGNAEDNVVLEWSVADPAAAVFRPANPAAPFREVLRVEAPFANHTIGLVSFNPTAVSGDPDYGRLYIGLGDGGSGGDPLALAQNRARAHGKILRIDPLGSNSANGRYGIPADNPFVGADGTLPEIWALGLRNPQRFVWDANGVHRMFIADIGQGVVEEIDLGQAGANYGWGQREGSYACVDGGQVGANARADSAATGFTYPVAEYDHSEGSAITTGPVYRGQALPALTGKLVFGDIANGRIFLLDDFRLASTGGPSAVTELRLLFDGTERRLLEQIQLADPSAARVDLRFGQDLGGRLFVLNKQDGIIRILTAGRQPTVRITGGTFRFVTSPAARANGRAASSIGVSKVIYRVNRDAARVAEGRLRWHLVARRLHLGNNRITIRAVDLKGVKSKPAVLIVVRR